MEDCTICHEPCEEPKTLQKCMHTFCKVCIDSWFKINRSCPYCRCEYEIYKALYDENNLLTTLENYNGDSLSIFTFGLNVSLIDCPNITDVSALANVKKLTLKNCPGISNVNNLANLQDLTIENCHGITDVTGLANVKKLKINFCARLSKINNLANVKKLKVNFCPCLVNVAGLANVKTIKINFCPGIADLADI